MKYLCKIPLPLILFLALWAWAWGWWGDVLWTAHERSFFAFENELVQHVWSKSFGTLWLMGRALLTLGAWPWLAGLVLAAILTGVACCLKYVFARKQRHIVPLCYTVPVLWVAWLTFYSFDVYFKGEPGRIFGIPALALIVAGIQAVFVWSFRRRKASGSAPAQKPSPLFALPVALMVAIPLWELGFRPWTRPTCAMERCYAAEDWDGIRRIATDNATVSCRPMAAYYAIALVRQDAIMKHLFDIRFEYDDPYMHDWNGQLMNNAPYYIFDCDMHAGLLQFAYHKAIEDMTVDGPTNHNLKALAMITAMRHENKVCRKYLDILDRTPGNSAFTERWRTYMADNRRMEADATVKGIRDLEPIHDEFESAYTEPAFLGYNLKLYEGRSRQALINSIAVCLYTKLNEPFLERAQYLDANSIMQNQHIVDALAMQAIKRQDILQALPQLKFNVDRYRAFVGHIKSIGATGDTQQRMPFAEGEFKGSNIGYYPYYYYFGNLRATHKDAAAKYGYGHKDGVN